MKAIEQYCIKLLRRTFAVYYALPDGSSISGHETKIGEGCMQALGPNQVSSKEWLSRSSGFHRPNWSLPLHYTSMKSLKILKNQSLGPDAVVYGPYRYKTWWYADAFFIYRLDPRDNPKRKWKPTMSLSQCLTLITIANFISKGTSRRWHSDSVSNYFVQAPYGDVQSHFGGWNQVCCQYLLQGPQIIHHVKYIDFK